MNLYSEIYNSYYNIISTLIRIGSFTDPELMKVVEEKGFGETMLYLIPKISEGRLSLFEKEGEVYTSVLHNGDMEGKNLIPLSLLQKMWLRAVLEDKRIALFLDEVQLALLKKNLESVEPLFQYDDFEYVDRFADGDNYEDEEYRNTFRIILNAIRNRQVLDISFNSHKDKRVHFHFIPCKIEYSVKNDKFRLYAVERREPKKDRLYTINLSRISEIGIVEDEVIDPEPDLDKLITSEYYKEPVTLLIKTERNALERAMLQFASYKKNTVRISDDLYKCEIFYNEGNETELLIEVLSFGSAVEVLGNERFLGQMKYRIRKQIESTSQLF